MTLKQYLAEPQSLQSDAVVTAIIRDQEPRGAIVRLDRTLFHPQGGGQKADAGTIGGALVVHARHADGEVDHIIAGELPFAEGDTVVIEIDRSSRDLNRRLHTAGHLLAYVAEGICPSIKATAGHHWPTEARVDFEGPLDTDAEVFRAALEAGLAEQISADLPVVMNGDPYVDRRIAIGEFPEMGCGGTHVRATGEIGKVTIGRIKTGANKMRVRYDVV